jgi:hypothetical protein
VVRFINNCRVSLAQALASTARTLHGNKRGWCERSGARRGPAPTSRPTFPAEFLAQAPKIVHQRTGRYQLRQRATLVLLCHEPPLVANTEAAACVHRHPHSVRLWRRRWAHGTVVLEDESGRGPQPRFSPLDHAVVQAIACAVVDETARLLRRPSLGDLPGRACRTLSRPISRSTVWRKRHADALKPWR